MGTHANLGSHGTHMTPCVIRDSELGYAPSRDHPERSCVGCGAPPEAIAEARACQARGWDHGHVGNRGRDTTTLGTVDGAVLWQLVAPPGRRPCCCQVSTACYTCARSI